MNKTGKRLLKFALGGWAVAFLAASIFLGGEDSLFDIKSLLFLSLAPGAITGLIIGHIMNKNDAPKSIEFSKSPESRLIELKNLLDQGVLSQEEFDEQKKKILNS